MYDVLRADRCISVNSLEARVPFGDLDFVKYVMWEFLDRLFNVALPRVRDFHGINPDGFDGRGNYSLGLKEQIIFPEIDYDKIEKLRGMNIAICTTAQSDEEARELLSLMGAPFAKA